jgi:ubiquitin-conjugating enzyme E2 Z
MSTEKISILKKDTITRLLQDVKQIIKNPLTDNGIYYSHDDEDMLKGYALIIGPKDTPYYGGFYFFEIHYPANYPYSPPHVVYCTNGENIRFNPNLYTNGKVCVSILNTWRGEQWTPCQTITSLLLTLCTLLCKDPLLNEPGVTTSHADFDKYVKIIDYKNIDISILKIVNKSIGVYPEKFDFFYSIVKEQFIKTSDDILKYLENKANEQQEESIIKTGMYSMTVKINYPELRNKYKETLKQVLSSSMSTGPDGFPDPK